jgi:hypothetical protein
MFAGRQRNFRGCSAVPEVHMMLVRRYRQPQVRQVGIDQQVVVPRMWLIIAGLDDLHAFDAELDPDRVGYCRTVGRRYEKDTSACSRGCALYCHGFSGRGRLNRSGRFRSRFVSASAQPE